MTIFSPYIFHQSRRRYRDLGGRGGRNQAQRLNRFLQRVLEYRDFLCRKELYSLLRTHAEKQRVQLMLLEFIELNGGRCVKQVPGRRDYLFVLSRREAMKVCAAKLRDGPVILEFDATSIHTIPLNGNETIPDDFNITEISF